MEHAHPVLASGSAAQRRLRGPLTARVAQQLKKGLGPEYEVYCNHPLPNGEQSYRLEELPLRCTRGETELDLGSADIVVTRDGEVKAVVEIEESSSKPRLVLGDLDAYTQAESVGFRGEGEVTLLSARRIVLYPRLGRDPQGKRDFFRGHACDVASLAGAAVPTWVEDFGYDRAVSHRPATPGEDQRAGELADRIRAIAGLG